MTLRPGGEIGAGAHNNGCRLGYLAGFTQRDLVGCKQPTLRQTGVF